MRFGLTSNNEVKYNAVCQFLKEILTEKYAIVRVQSESGVSAQPMSLHETKKGAVNRILNAHEDNIDYYISIESGVDRNESGLESFTVAAVSDGNKSKFGFGKSASFQLPDYAVRSLYSGNELSATSQGQNGMIGVLTNDFMKRLDLIKQALTIALVPFHFFKCELPDWMESVTKYAGELSEIERNSLAAQLRELDFTPVRDLYENSGAGITAIEDPVEDDELMELYMDNGREAIRYHELAVVIMAGGQGSRLSASMPKALFKLDIPSESTLLELQCLRIRKMISMIKDSDIPLYIMTSDGTHSSIEAYLVANDNFGLKHVMLFKQGTLPARLMSGDVAMSSKSKVLAAPDGNGSIFKAMKETGVIDDMKRRGVKYVQIHPIDNALVVPADPKFVGKMVYEGADAGIKVVRKLGANEKTGTICQKNGRVAVVEYSEIPESEAQLHKYGNTAIHLFTLDLIERVTDLKFHVATKNEHVLNESGEIELQQVHKYERFIFDALEYSESTVVMVVNREEEFAPVKNGSGPVDSPESAKKLLVNLHKKWAEEAGIDLTGEGDFEVLPQTAYDSAELEKFSGMTLSLPTMI